LQDKHKYKNNSFRDILSKLILGIPTLASEMSSNVSNRKTITRKLRKDIKNKSAVLLSATEPERKSERKLQTLLHNKWPSVFPPKLTKRRPPVPRTSLDAPAATHSLGTTTFFRRAQVGEDIVVHARDRLSPLSITVASGENAADANYSGAVLVEVALNPESLGERLRREASVFEMFRFESASAVYEGATGSSAVGSILGFFDQDPVDQFDAGRRSLEEAAAHPGAHSVKVWEAGRWIMPPRIGGRFYVGTSGTTSADKRLQSQGTFRIMLDIPLAASAITTDVPTILGSLYMEYKIRLMKPTIQPNFVGTSDVITFTPDAATQLVNEDNIIGGMDNVAGILVPVYNPRNNGGCQYLKPGANEALSCIEIPEGLWNINITMLVAASTPAAADLIFTFKASDLYPTSVNDFLSANVNSLGSLESATTATPMGYRLMTSAAGPSTDYVNCGCQLLVPSGAYKYLTFSCNNAAAASFTISSLEFSASMTWPSSAQLELINPASLDIGKRLLAAERKIIQMMERNARLSVEEPPGFDLVHSDNKVDKPDCKMHRVSVSPYRRRT
jgi:hypothetical protein